MAPPVHCAMCSPCQQSKFEVCLARTGDSAMSAPGHYHFTYQFSLFIGVWTSQENTKIADDYTHLTVQNEEINTANYQDVMDISMC